MSGGGGRRIRQPTGRFLRPKTVTLPASAVIPSRNLIEPAPRHFTHRLARDEPYFFLKPGKGIVPAGHFPAGTPVLLLSTQGRTGWVADRRGLHVAVACASLQKL
jgi:hypothetical protein